MYPFSKTSLVQDARGKGATIFVKNKNNKKVPLPTQNGREANNIKLKTKTKTKTKKVFLPTQNAGEGGQ